MNIGNYNPVNFEKISDVLLVGHDDEDYQKWRKKTYKKKLTKSQKRRKNEIIKYPSFFRHLKKLWLSEEYENIKIEVRCGNCCFINEDRCHNNKFICWKLHEELGYKRKPDRVTKDFVCEKFKPKKEYYSKEQYVKEKLKNSDLPHPKGFHEKIYSTIGLKYYLHDLGVLKDKPINIGKKAKQNEYEFKNNIQKIPNIKTVDKVFKIYQKNDTITFKIPDVIFIENKKYSIIEYKNRTYYGNFQQLLDYGKLFKLATVEPLKNLYWVIHKTHSCDGFTEFKNRAPKEMQVCTETDFIEKYNPDWGWLDSWM